MLKRGSKSGGMTFYSLIPAFFMSAAIVLCLGIRVFAAGPMMPPADAAVGDFKTYKTYDFKIVNPGWEGLTKGGLVHVRVYRPLMKQGPFPGVVMVPPPQRAGVMAVSDRWGKDAGRLMDAAVSLAESGLAVALYNPPGQGKGDFASSGDDGRGGYMSQDALASVVRAVREMDFVDWKNIGICAEGGGLSTAAGALARHSDLGVRWLLDIEGLWDNLELSGYTWSQITPEIGREYVNRYTLYYLHSPTSQNESDENITWWSRREPRTFARHINLQYYQRLQFEVDQTQPPTYFAHALRMYEGILSSRTLHARYNHYPWDMALPPKRVPGALPGRLDDNYVDTVRHWALDLASIVDDSIPARELPPAVEPDYTPLPRPFTFYY